jgi:hypothetical protein
LKSCLSAEITEKSQSAYGDDVRREESFDILLGLIIARLAFLILVTKTLADFRVIGSWRGTHGFLASFIIAESVGTSSVL